MKDIGVQERIGEERPQIGAKAAGKLAADSGIDVL